MYHPSLDAIRSAPDDDAPRLAYAAGLPSGDARADLIRHQCALARKDDDDPTRPPLEAAVSRVAIDPAWTAAFDAAGLRMPWMRPAESWHFKPPHVHARGFVEHVFAKASVLVAHGAALADAHPIRSLAIEGATRNDAAALVAEPWLARVERLSTDASGAALAALLGGQAVALRRLKVSLGGRALAALLPLPGLTRLRALDVDVPDDLAAAAQALAAAAPETIEELRFGCAMSGWGSATGQRSTDASSAGGDLARMLRSPRLARLTDLRFDVIDEDAVDAIAALPSLARLDVSRPSDAIAARLIERVAPRLRRLYLGHAGALSAASLARAELGTLDVAILGSGIGEDPMPAVDLARALRGLVAPSLRALVLALRHTPIDVAVVDALAHLRAPSLVRFVCGSSAAPGGLSRILAAPLAARLTTLRLGIGKDQRADVEALAAAELPALQRLAVGYPTTDAVAASDAAITTIANSRGLPQLRHLEFGGAANQPSFGTAGAKALAATKLPELAILYIQPMAMAAGAYKKLEARFAVYPGASWSSGHLPFVGRGHLEA